MQNISILFTYIQYQKNKVDFIASVKLDKSFFASEIIYYRSIMRSILSRFLLLIEPIKYLLQRVGFFQVHMKCVY